MHRFIVGTLATASLVLASPLAASAAPGQLDTTYGSKGRAIPALGGTSSVLAITRTTTGNGVLAATVFGHVHPVLASLTTNGLLDPHFSDDGMVDVPLDNVLALGPAVDGGVLVYGTDGASTTVLRVTTDGTVDHGFASPSFGAAGMAFAPGTDGSYFTVRADALAGQVFVNHFNADGAPDAAYGHAAEAALPIPAGGAASVRSAVTAWNGELVVDVNVLTGPLDSGHDYVFRVPTDGRDPRAAVEVASSTTANLDGGGKLVIASGGKAPVLWRYNANGSLDTTFGRKGAAKLPANVVVRTLLAMGTTVVAGADGNPGKAVVIGLDGSGKPATGFGRSGAVGVPKPKGATAMTTLWVGDGSRVLVATNAVPTTLTSRAVVAAITVDDSKAR